MSTSFILLALAAQLAPAAEDWPLPPPAQIHEKAIEPQRIFDIKASGLRGATQGYVLDDGRILFWGDAENVTQRSISIIDPTGGRIETLWRSDVLHLKVFLLTPDRKALWFCTEKYEQLDRFYVLDIANRRVWPMEEIYDESALLIQAALKDDRYWNARMEADGRLSLEWGRWFDIANWWGKTPAEWHMVKDSKSGPGKDVYSRAYLPSPVKWFKQDGKAPHLPVTFDVSFQKQLKQLNDRPKPKIDADGHYYAPLHSGMYFGPLHTLPLPGYGLTVQNFNRYTAPGTMQPCGVGNNSGGLSSTESSDTCARYQGAYVEQTADGKLVHILNHGVGVPEGAVVRGRLFAMTGITEGSQPARYVSLWDAPAGKLLAHFALPEEAVGYAYPYTVLFSNDSRELYCISSYPRPKLFIWPLEPAWRKLAVTRAPAPVPPAK
jgi:hypothetical protein